MPLPESVVQGSRVGTPLRAGILRIAASHPDHIHRGIAQEGHAIGLRGTSASQSGLCIPSSSGWSILAEVETSRLQLGSKSVAFYKNDLQRVPVGHRVDRFGQIAPAAGSAGRSAPRPCGRSCRAVSPSAAPARDLIRCTQTNRIPRSAASWPSTRHRRPVSHDTVTPTKPFAAARSRAQSSAIPRSQARQRNVLRASTFESWSQTTIIFFFVGQVDPDDRIAHRHGLPSLASRALRLRSPRVTPVPLTMNVLLSAMGHQARQAHQETSHVQTSGAERLSRPLSERIVPPCRVEPAVRDGPA